VETITMIIPPDLPLHMGGDDGDDLERPVTRGDCENEPRPCPWVGCRYHFFFEVIGRILKIPKDKIPSVPDDVLVNILEKMEYTCILDWAAKGPNTLEQIGQMFGLTRERVRQIEFKGLRHLEVQARRAKIDVDLKDVLADIANRPGVFEWR
jgi:hypothetical protein